MSFIIVDGFDDRKFIERDNIDSPYDYQGYGLYADHEEDFIYTGYSYGSCPARQNARYDNGWSMMLTDNIMVEDYVEIEKYFDVPKHIYSGGYAWQGLNYDPVFLAHYAVYPGSSSLTKYGPQIECDSYGGIQIKRTKQFTWTSEVIASSARLNKYSAWGWHEIEFSFEVLNPGSDWIKVWLDGELMIDLSGTTLNWNQAPLLQSIKVPYGAMGCDDIWLRDDTTVYERARILALFPNGAGTYTDGTPVGNGANYLNVNEHEQDFDGTYNAVGAGKDSFQMSDITAQVSAGTVHGLVVRVFAKGEAGNTDQILPFVIVNGNKYDGVASLPPEDTYWYIQHIWETNPDTSNPWTVSEIDAVEIGYEIV